MIPPALLADQPVVVFWHRRDLRNSDNAGLYHALRHGRPVVPLFIFDKQILSKLEYRSDARVGFIHESIHRLKENYELYGSSLLVLHGDPLIIMGELIRLQSISAVYANEDYEEYGIQRDNRIKRLLAENGISFCLYKDHVVFAPGQVLKSDGSPYTVFTPYMKAWRNRLTDADITPYNTDQLLVSLVKTKPWQMPSLAEIGFDNPTVKVPEARIDQNSFTAYHLHRDIPSIDRTTRLGPHLRFGTLSIRQVAAIAGKLNQVLLNELIWREFFMMIMYYFPYSASGAFKRRYNRIHYTNDENQFELWKSGNTGYPIVDAGMRQLATTGFMHNRVRMIAASFLSKHLLIDWRWGEAWFAIHLIDYELSSNVGNWQWAVGSGCDAAPWFRIFNPLLQQQKFDPQFSYIKQWVPEFVMSGYIAPIVNHTFARQRAVVAYKKALSDG